MRRVLFLGVFVFALNYIAKAQSGAEYAHQAAKEAKNAYLHARFASFTTSKSKLKHYSKVSIRSSKKAIRFAKKAIESSPKNLRLVESMENCRLDALKTIQLISKIPTNNYKNYHEYANLAAVSAGNAIINAYDGMLAADDISNIAEKETKVEEVLAKLDEKEKQENKLTPKKTQKQEAKKANSQDNEGKKDTSNKGKTGYIPTQKDLDLAKRAIEKQTYLKEEPSKPENNENKSTPLVSYIIGGTTLLSLASAAVYGHFAASKSTAIAVASPESLFNQPGSELNKFINQFATLGAIGTSVQMSIHPFNILALPRKKYESVVNLNKINDIKDINGFFAAVNKKLEPGGHHIACVETSDQRKRRLLHKFPLLMAQVYYMLDFVFKRIFPKLPFTRSIYFFVTAGRNRVITAPEALGRMAAAGFAIEETKEIDNHLFFVGKKEKEPKENPRSSEGLFFKMKRIGKNEKPITVFKFRTMHPYAEYLQQYVYDRNHLKEGGKINNDFRVSAWGKFMRKLWIDELPMVINLIKGEIKLVGVRPLSQHFLSLYNQSLQELRKKHKPGLIPPFYVDLPKTLEDIMASEEKYLKQYEKTPLKTDLSYFFKAVFNIVFKRARSN